MSVPTTNVKVTREQASALCHHINNPNQVIVATADLMKMKLRPYQVVGKDFLKSIKHGCLYDEPGLGKTPQTIFAAKELGLKRILVICPAVAKYNWQNEFKKFVGWSSFVAEKGSLYLGKNKIITSFDYAMLYAEHFNEIEWDLIIIDEAHFLKEPSAKRTKKILGVNGTIHRAKRVWMLTGTPAPNHAGELWTTLFTFGKTKLSYEGFISRYCECHIESGIGYSRTQITGTNTKNSPELKSVIKEMSIRRLKKDVLTELPPITHNQFYIKGDTDSAIFKKHPELKEKIREELEALKEEMGYDHLNISDDKMLNALSFLGQSISSLRRYHGLKKIKETAEIIRDELNSQAYDKVIVFGIHTDVLETLRSSLNDFQSVMITGKTPNKARPLAVSDFQEDPNTKIFYGNILAAGTAITLTAASQVIFIEQDWVPGNNRQAADRAHRFGQLNPVNARYIAIKDSLDDKITGTILRKIKELETFLD